MSEETQQTTFDLTCSDGTIFTLPSNHPEITAGGIGGVSYNAILADPSQIPAEFEQFCTFRPPPVEYSEPEPIEIAAEGVFNDYTLAKCDQCETPTVCIISKDSKLCVACLTVEFADVIKSVAEFGNP